MTILSHINSPSDLIDPTTGKYYSGKVDITGTVILTNGKLTRFPVQFGKVRNSFYCFCNQLTSLKGAPKEVYGNFSCSVNVLTTLEGAPEVVNGHFFCERAGLVSLEGIHKIIKRLNGYFYLNDNPIRSGGIGLLLIEGLTYISTDQPAFKIIREYLGKGKAGLLRCQEELIENGYEEYAKL